MKYGASVYFRLPKTAFRYKCESIRWHRVRFTKEQLTDGIHVVFVFWNAQTSIKISEYFDFAVGNIHTARARYRSVCVCARTSGAQNAIDGSNSMYVRVCEYVWLDCNSIVVWEYRLGATTLKTNTTATMTTISWMCILICQNWILTYFPAWHFMLRASCPSTHSISHFIHPNIVGPFYGFLVKMWSHRRRLHTAIVRLLSSDTEWFIDDDALILPFHMSHLSLHSALRTLALSLCASVSRENRKIHLSNVDGGAQW